MKQVSGWAYKTTWWFCIGLTLLVSACGEGVGTKIATTGSSEQATVTVAIATPTFNKKPDNGGGAEYKVLTASQSFSVSVTGGGIATPVIGTANKSGTGITTITLQVPIGTARTFTAKAFDAANATGNEISYGAATSDVVAGVNTINMTLNVIPRTIVSPVSAVTTAGTATTLSFSANDADGVTISNSPTTLITWTVVGGAANGTVDANGVYTPPATSGTASQSVTVQAASAVDATTPAVTATLTLNNPSPILFAAGAPTGVTLSSGGVGTIKISWNPLGVTAVNISGSNTVYNISGSSTAVYISGSVTPVSYGNYRYKVYWSTTSGVTPNNAMGSFSDIYTNFYEHTGLTTGTRYYYIVTAVSTGGESVASSEVSALSM